LQINSGLIVEKFYVGKDYRIVVIENEVIAAYQRLPLSVIGDGESTILELLHQKQENFIQSGRKKIIDFDDFRIKRKLKRQNLNFSSIIPNGKIIYILDNANLSSGGEAVDVTESIHPDFQKLALNVAKEMGLRLIGLDIITHDLTRPMVDYVIIEVNGSPSLTHYASIGDVQIQRVEQLYLKILQALEKDYHSQN
jgi:D-alanine-D-alanine ligase-like ATP-grasp enzyme